MIELLELASRFWGQASIMKNPKLEARFIEEKSTQLGLKIAIETGTLTEIVNRPAFFYLDAHFCRDDPRAVRTEDHPLFAELAAIAKRPFADLVWIDDVHTFGQDRDDLAQSWREITKETIKQRLGDRAGVSAQVGDGFAIELKGEEQ